MKKIFTAFLALVAVVSLQAQSDKQVKWTFESKKIAENTYELHMTAEVGGNFHIYSQNAGDGPMATTFTFTKSPLVTLDGTVKELGKQKKVFEEVFNSEVRYFEKKVDFVQVVKVKGKAKTNVAGKVEFIVCNDRECLPPSTVNFKVAVGG